jgi:NAD(P)-dependent dehydrogenase (short-subunit alcohol dehydrogenase family)
MQGAVIAITGAASGIGLATAKVLASRGAILSIADNRAEPLQAAAESIASTYGVEVMATTIDVRKRQDCEEWIKKTVDKFGRLDGAANLAGVIGPSMGKKTIAEFDDDAEWEFILGVNVTGM